MDVFSIILSAFFVTGVFGVKVSVTEGDSVTLYSDTKTNQAEKIIWYNNGIRIAQINKNLNFICTDSKCNKDNEMFVDRLTLDHQTGSLTIMNIRKADAGDYYLEIIGSRSNSERIFTVNIDGAKQNRMKSKSVALGKSVRLDAEERLKNDVFWYFNGILIAEIAKDQSKICTEDRCKESFRDRLQLDHQTGSLIITNTKNNDTGEFILEIISSTSSFSVTKTKRFTVTVTNPHGNNKILYITNDFEMMIIIIVIIIMLVCYLCKILQKRQQLRQDYEVMSVVKGDSFTLNTNDEIQIDNLMTFFFGATVIAEVNGETGENSTSDDALAGKFRGRMELDKLTGSLTIKDCTTTDCGDYQLHLCSRRKVVGKSKFLVKVFDEIKSAEVKKGESFTLHTDDEIQRDDLMQWMLGNQNSVIAEIKGEEVGVGVVLNDAGRSFTGRLRLDHRTGSLTIRNVKKKDAGQYKLSLIRSDNTSLKLFNVTVNNN